MLPSLYGAENLGAVNFVGGLQSGADIHGISDDGVVLVAFAADVTHDHIPGV